MKKKKKMVMLRRETIYLMLFFELRMSLLFS